MLISVSKLKHMAESNHKPIFMVINLWENGTLLIYSKLRQVLRLMFHIQEDYIEYQVNHHGEIVQVIMYSVEIN